MTKMIKVSTSLCTTF